MPYYLEQRRRELQGLAGRIAAAEYAHLADLKVTAWVTREPAPFARRRSGKKIELKPGMKWGNLFDCAWFRFTGRVPKEAAGKKVVLLIVVNGEACVVDARGNPALGLTGMGSTFDFSLGRPGKRVVRAGRRGGDLSASASYLQMDAPNVILDAVKKAEDDDRLILRLYEAHGAQVRAKVTFGFKVGRAELVNLMEEEPRPVAVRDGAVGVEFRPFEVHTLRVERGKS